jgi:hypothetical protein
LGYDNDIEKIFRELRVSLEDIKNKEHVLIEELIESEKNKNVIKNYLSIKDIQLDTGEKAILISENVGSNVMVSSTETLLPEEVNISYLLKELKSTCLSKAYLTHYMLKKSGIESNIVLGETQYGYHAVIQLENKDLLVEQGFNFKPAKTMSVPDVQDFVNKYN